MVCLDDVRTVTSENDLWERGEPGKIRTLDEVEDMNLHLSMELARLITEDRDIAKALNGFEVFHVICGEGYFNAENERMARRVSEKRGIPVAVCRWVTQCDKQQQ